MDNSHLTIFNDFLDDRKRSLATHQLADLGPDAITLILKALNGELVNEYGHQYRKIGALNCILITCRMLKDKIGKLPDDIEFFIHKEALSGNNYAVEYFDSTNNTAN
jgi:hypothetical protein